MSVKRIHNVKNGNWLVQLLKLELDKMSRTEKVEAMEALWQALSRDEELLDSPDWHKDELIATEQRIASGEEQFMDWEIAKQQLRQYFSS